MEAIWQDIRYGFRMLVKERVLTLIAVLTLALGIGANTAIFSLFDQILLRKLPVKNPNELVVLYSPGPLQGRATNDENRAGGSWSYPMYKDLRDKNQVFSGLLACFNVPVSVAAQNSTERAVGMIVSGNFFEVLGVRAAAGRLLTQEDDLKPGEHPVAVLSHDYWKRRFGSNPNVVNQSVIINGHPYTIIGVAQEGFYGVQIGRGRDVYLPIAMKAQVTPTWNGLDDHKDYWAKLIGRLKPGMTREQAEAGLLVTYKPLLEAEAPLQKRFSKEGLERFVNKKIELADGAQGRQVLQADAGEPLKILMGMVGLVLLIACANVSNLLIARSAGRQKEIAVRLSLGADRWRLMRQLLVESMMLALLGGGLGLLVASWTQAGLVQLLSTDTSMSNLSSQLDARVLAFNFGLAILTGLLFGLVPSLKASRPDLNTTLKDLGGSVSAGITQVRFRKVLVVAQMALTVVLVVAAGLFAHSLYNLHNVELGVRTDRLVQFSIAPELNGYTPPRSIALFQQIEDSLAELPGVDGVSAAAIGAFENSAWNSTISVEGYEPKEGENMHPSVNMIAPRYFSTMGTPLLAGRDFTRQDAAAAPKVIIINELFAKKWFAGRDPIGRKIAFGSGPGTKLDMEIVGVVKDFKHSDVGDDVRPFVFYPYMQDKNAGDITFYVRSQSDPQILYSALRREVQKLDANLPIYNFKTLEVQIQESLIGERVTAILSVAFGALAAMLAAIGVYGVMAYSVTRRTREIGIRMALGAKQSDVRGMILREVARMAAIGIIVGLPASYGVGKLAESILYGVQPADILTAVAAVLLIVLVAFCAGFFPARRATQINPITALRYE